jgi:hypothetical protein
MGRVKFNAGGLLYIHGTPDTTSLGRAASHGCLRISNADAIELARLIHRHASVGPGPEELRSLQQNPSRTRTFTLAEPVPLTIVYQVAEVRDASLVLHPDVYARLGTSGAFSQALDALGGAGFASERVDRKRLEELVRAGARATVSAPIDALLAPIGRAPGSAPQAQPPSWGPGDPPRP